MRQRNSVRIVAIVVAAALLITTLFGVGSIFLP